jgi:hypothetical protein
VGANPFGNGGASTHLTYGKCVPHPQVRAGNVARDNRKGWDGADRRSSSGSPSPLVQLLPATARSTTTNASRHSTGTGALAFAARAPLTIQHILKSETATSFTESISIEAVFGVCNELKVARVQRFVDLLDRHPGDDVAKA